MGTDLRRISSTVERTNVVDGIFWILQTGAPWLELPEESENWKAVWDLFNKWNQDRTLDDILDRLRTAAVADGQIDQELWCVDVTSVRAARYAGGARKLTTGTNQRSKS